MLYSTDCFVTMLDMIVLTDVIKFTEYSETPIICSCILRQQTR